jgi:hypothetical protein
MVSSTSGEVALKVKHVTAAGPTVKAVHFPSSSIVAFAQDPKTFAEDDVGTHGDVVSIAITHKVNPNSIASTRIPSRQEKMKFPRRLKTGPIKRKLLTTILIFLRDVGGDGVDGHEGDGPAAVFVCGWLDLVVPV